MIKLKDWHANSMFVLKALGILYYYLQFKFAIMLKHHFKIAWRNLWKDKFYSLTNMAALSIGLTAGIFILVWVQNELSFDGFHTNSKNIYRVLSDVASGAGRVISAGVPAPVATQSRHTIPEVTNAVRTSAKNAQKAITAAKKQYKKYAGDTPFIYHFVDKQFAAQYLSDQRTGTLCGLFAIIAIFISCLGLFGLTTFAAQVRTKETGIRKVLGASVASVVTLLSKDFIRLVLIAMVTVSGQSVRAAMGDPVRSLRNE